MIFLSGFHFYHFMADIDAAANFITIQFHIFKSFLDFDLPGIPPEFYGTYKLLNVKNNAEYSDKLTLSVVNLRHIDLATEEDKKYHIDKWAELFKATTWEEIKMIAGKDEYLNEAASELFKRLADLTVLEEYEARERYYRDQRRLSRLEQETVEKDKLITKKDKDIAEKDKAIDALSNENQRLRELLAQNHISV